MTETKIFLTGASGYIGGSVFQNLIQNKDYSVTVLVRGEERAKVFRDLGAKAVVGDLDDVAKLRELSANSDVVIHTADADHLASAKAIIEGLQQKAKEGGKRPILIHTSGTGVLIDRNETVGEQASPKVYSEAPLGDINGISQDALHRNVDIEVLKAGEWFDVVIICPPLIYGKGSGPFNVRSIQLPALVQSGILHKRAYHAGKGLNVWNNVHVLDLADLYSVVLENALKGKAPVNKEGYYFAENGENNFVEVTDQLAKVLHDKGISQFDKSEEFPKEVAEKYKLLVLFTGLNSRGKAEKGRSLGWKPHRPSLIDSIAEEVDYWLQQSPESFTINRLK